MSKPSVNSAPPLLTAADIIEDSALKANDPDLFDHSAIAGRVAELVRCSPTPLNIALYGPWGSGKSSFFQLMQRELEGSRIRTVRYDAWKYGGASLKKNFISSAARELDLPDDFDDRLYESRKTVRLDLKGFVKHNWQTIVAIILGAVLVGVAWTVVGAWVNPANRNFSWTDGPEWRTIFRRLPPTLATSLASVGAIAALFRFADIGKVNIDRSAPSGDEEFMNSFESLVKAGLKKSPKAERLVFFIDELDRCAPKDVVATLTDLKTFLDYPDCVFVVAVDREVLETALTEALTQSTPQRENEPYYSTAGAFLDKIFQQQVSLPPLRQHTLTHFARDLVHDKQEGVWQYLRDAQDGGRLRDEVIYALIPAHVRSPRRVKVLLNNFATNVRIAEARGFLWKDRAPEIAALTVLQAEFPPVVQDLYSEPRLLDMLRAAVSSTAPLSDNARRLVDKYKPSELRLSNQEDLGGVQDEETEEGESAAGVLLGGARDNERLNERTLLEFNRYLGRLGAARITTPKPDMLYLQAAGELEGLHDTSLGNVIDLGADVDPAETARAFDGADPNDAVLAIRLLAERSDNDFGPGRDNLCVAACLLARHQSRDALAGVATGAAPSIRQRVDSDSIRDTSGALAGALRLAISANDQDMTHAVIQIVTQSGAVHPDTLDQVVQDLPHLDPATRDTLADSIADAFKTDNDSLVNMIETTPEEVTVAVLRHIAPSVAATIEAAGTPDEPEPVAPTPTAVTRTSGVTTPEPTPPSTSDWEAAAEEAVDLLLTLLEACGSRDDNSAAVRSEVLLTAIASGIPAVITTALQDAQNHLVQAPPEDLNRLAFTALAQSQVDQEAAWIALIRPDAPVDASLAVRAVERSTTSALTGDSAVADVVAGAVKSGSLDPDSAQGIVDQITKVLDENRASTYVIDHRLRALYRAAYALEATGAKDVGRRLAADWIALPNTLRLDTEVDHTLTELLAVLAPQDVATAAEALETMTATSGEEVDILRLRVAAALLLREASLDFAVPTAEDFLATTGNPIPDETLTLVVEWVRLMPPVQDVIAVLRTWETAGAVPDELVVAVGP